jgi:hypothetical protein
MNIIFIKFYPIKIIFVIQLTKIWRDVLDVTQFKLNYTG